MAIIVPIAITDDRIVITQLNLPQIFLHLFIVMKLRLKLNVYCLSKHSVFRLIYATYLINFFPTVLTEYHYQNKLNVGE